MASCALSCQGSHDPAGFAAAWLLEHNGPVAGLALCSQLFMVDLPMRVLNWSAICARAVVD